MNFAQAHLEAMAGIWFSHAFGHRTAEQKRLCERLGWYYLMQSIMTELRP
jgi:hypothetical protein